jgi:hypothetical protein
MTDLLAYAASLVDAAPGRGAAPVDLWNPPYRGELDLRIRRDGVWEHEGAPIVRARLVRLFASVLKREGERYYLVTPYEKLGVKVEDAPFLAVMLRSEAGERGPRLVFGTNVGEEIVAGPAHPLEYRRIAVSSEKAPYLLVRRNLWALVSRAAFYDLVAWGETRECEGEMVFGVESDGVFFKLEAAERVFGGTGE